MTEITGDNKMNLFRNEIYSHIRELETQLNTKINKIQVKINSDFDSYSSKIKSLIENNKDMVFSFVSQKLKLEKITELEIFKKKMDDMIITHELRIKNNIDEIAGIKLKYDKIVSENLYVPGFVGSACQFKNLAEYLSYNISEVSKLKMEKDQLKKDIKEIKGKFDGLMKNMINLNDTSVQLCNKYTDNKQTEFQKMLVIHKEEVSQKNMENRMLICQFQEKAEKTQKKYQEEFSKLLEMKKDVINIIDEKMLENKKFTDELNQKLANNNLDIDINKKKIETINEQIKDLNQNTKDISFQVRNYYCANNKLSNFIERLDKLGNNSSNADISKLFQINLTNNTTNNNKINSNNMSPIKKITNKQNLTKSALNLKYTLDDIKPMKININKSVLKKKKIFNRIGINAKNQTYESESSSISNFSNDNANDNDNGKNNKKKNNEDENKKENKNNKDIVNKKINNLIIENPIDKNNKNEEIIKINENTNTLPSLTRNYKVENTLDENKKSNISLNDVDKNNILIKDKTKTDKNEKKLKFKKYELIDIINNEFDINKIKLNQKKELIIKKDYQLLEQDKQACKLVTLKLQDPLKEAFITKKNKIQKDKYKNDMNSLINSYRAKLFYKSHSPDEKNEFTNEILDIPKKVTQAFGRTTYNFYFKKDKIRKKNANININNFPNPNSKSNYKDFKLIRDDTG